MKKLPVLLATLCFWGCEVHVSEDTEVEFFSMPGTEDMPFSSAVRAGNLLFLSGAIGVVPGEGLKLAEGGIQGETRQTMDNIQAVLERYGSSLDRVVKCTVMIADIDEWGAFNEVYVTYFPGPKPARSAFESSGLAFDARVELECWAAN